MKIYSNRKGFTLLEVVAVLIIIGIITAVALTRLIGNQNNIITATDVLTSHLRLAQARAMNTSADNISTFSVWGVCFSSPTQYYLFYCPNASACVPAANQVAFLGASIIMNLAPYGVQVTTSGTGILAFDCFGTPYDAVASIPTQNSRTSVLTITLTDNNGNTKTINITPQTGMITKG